MAKQWGISRPRVIQSIEQLEKLNIISVDRASGKSNCYCLLDVSEWKVTSKPDLLVEQNTSQCDLLVNQQTSKPNLLVEAEPVNVVNPKVLKDLNTSPPTPPAIKFGKTKREKINIDYDTEIAKELGKLREDIQTAVTSFIDVAASENKTNTISQSRQWSLLCQLVGVSVATSDDVFKAALLEAIDRKKPSVNYLKEIIKSKSQRQVFGFSKRDPSPPPTCRDNPPGEKRTRYAQNRDGTWTRTNIDGTESVITNDEMETIKKRRTEDSKDSAQNLISRLANAKAM